MRAGFSTLGSVGIITLSLAALEMSAMQSGKQVVNVGRPSTAPLSSAVKAGDFIYASGALGVGTQGAPNDIAAQTKRVLDSLTDTLKAAGATMDRAASVQVYLKNAADFAAMNEVYKTYWSNDPPARTTVVSNLVAADALVEISVIAVRPGAERKVIHPADWMKSPNPYSYGIQSGDTLFLSGLVARNGKDNSIVTGDMAAQTKAVMDNGSQILTAAGFAFSDVVASRVYISDRAAFDDMNKVYRTYFPKDPPARATVHTGLMGPQYLVEVSMTAVKGARQVVVAKSPDGTTPTPNPNLSSAIKVGNRIYVSGMLGNTPATKGDITAQTKETLARIGRTLEAGGFSFGDVVDTTVYLTDMANFGGMNDGYRLSLTKDFPARATVGVNLVAPDGLVEIMMVAVK